MIKKKIEDLQDIIAPTGSIGMMRRDSIPEGWTALDGRGGTPNFSTVPLTAQNGHGPTIFYGSDYVWCMKGWEEFHKQYPEWKGFEEQEK